MQSDANAYGSNIPEIVEMDTSGLTKTGADGQRIQIDLSNQELLILKAHAIYLAAANARQYIESAVTNIPNLSSQGLFHNYIGADGDLAHYSLKAQQLQLLTEVLHQHAKDTFISLCDADEVLALEIGNTILNSQIPNTAAAETDPQKKLAMETSKSIAANDPQEAYTQIEQMVDAAQDGQG